MAAVMRATPNSAGRSRKICRIPDTSIKSRPIKKTTAESTASGMNSKGPVRKRSTRRTITLVVICANWLCPPALSTICVLVGLPLTTKAPVSPAPNVGEAEAHQVNVLAEAFVVTGGIGSRRRGALGQDYHKYGEGCGQELHEEADAQVHVGQAHRRDAAGNRAEDGDPVGFQVDRPAHGDGADDRDERAGEFPGYFPGAEDDDENGHGRYQGGQFDCWRCWTS